MTTLLAIWQLSLALCLAAFLALTLILIARFVAERRDTRTETERRRIARMLMTPHLDGPVLPTRKLEKDAAARLALEMAELVRGPDREALLANAEALRIPHTLLRSSVSRSAQIRLLAAEALAMFSIGQYRVRQMLRDRNPDVRLGAALALAQNQAAPPAAEIVRRLELGTSERSLLIASLMRDLVDADPASVEDLLSDDTLPDAARLAAVDALAASGRVEHAPLVARMAEEAGSDNELLPRIYHALGRIGHPSGHAAILRGLSHPVWAVRAAAAQAAGANRLAKAAEPLGALLGDDQWWVRLRAGEALWRLGSNGMAVLKKTAAGPHGLASEAAALTIEERGPA
ncbi:HEAT repeat domain-containing protein [uncultured Erythrobacter sp.]|uniref:HEAT repeat domain-containing protein n=1 Tax=uncultured Erythrobacter sp. TaxID=263913 RepID=UPI00265A8F5F|nr:HEAT repeat domain-containing protein [uncultured Erythrobacter sp.]